VHVHTSSGLSASAISQARSCTFVCNRHRKSAGVDHSDRDSLWGLAVDRGVRELGASILAALSPPACCSNDRGGCVVARVCPPRPWPRRMAEARRARWGMYFRQCRQEMDERRQENAGIRRPGAFIKLIIIGPIYAALMGIARLQKAPPAFRIAAIVIFAAMPVAYYFYVRHRAKRHASHPSDACPICGYDLRASPTQCPECGTPREGFLNRPSARKRQLLNIRGRKLKR